MRRTEMNRKLLSILATTVLMLTTSCNVTVPSSEEAPRSVSDPSSTEGSGPVQGIPDSYSLIDEGYVVPVVNQSQGTCWANTGAEVMRYDLMVTGGVDLDINVNDFVQVALGGDPDEGIEGMYSNNRPQAGGSHPLIVEAANNVAIDGYIMTEANDYSAAPREVIQEKIMTCGALTLAITGDQYYIDSIRANATLNIPDQELATTTHMVAIVGWDNNFSADEFDPVASGNGAWLIQDSQGTAFGDNGYYWLSYDTPLFGVCDFQLSDGYTEVISYENGVKATASTEGGTTVASVYDHEGTIGAIGTYTSGPDQTITVEIYDGEFGELLYSEEQTFEYTGYHTVELDEPLDVTTYTVVIRYPEGAPVEGDSYEVDMSFMGGALSGSYIGYYGSIEEGQSFILIGDEWIDMSTEGIGDLIEIRCDTLSTMPAWSEEEIHIPVIPNNPCIKVLYVA